MPIIHASEDSAQASLHCGVLRMIRYAILYAINISEIQYDVSPWERMMTTEGWFADPPQCGAQWRARKHIYIYIYIHMYDGQKWPERCFLKNPELSVKLRISLFLGSRGHLPKILKNYKTA